MESGWVVYAEAIPDHQGLAKHRAMSESGQDQPSLAQSTSCSANLQTVRQMNGYRFKQLGFSKGLSSTIVTMLNRHNLLEL